MELDQINESELLGFLTPDPTGILPLLGVRSHQDLELIILQAESLKSLNSDILISYQKPKINNDTISKGQRCSPHRKIKLSRHRGPKMVFLK